jgi:hypothetical protein
MGKLGFTFYPQDWWSSDSFFELDPFERYLYLECLFVMYQNGGYMKYTRAQMEKRLNLKTQEIKPKVWAKITQRFVRLKLGFTSDTITKRRKKAETSRENGQLGGRPKKKQKPKNPGNNLKKTHLLKENINIKENIKEKYLIVKPKYATEQIARITSLEDYFQSTAQLPPLTEKGWVHFAPFLDANPGAIFNDEQHLYNAFRNFCISYKPPTKKPDKFAGAQVDFDEMYWEAFKDIYEFKLQHDDEFREHFEGQNKLRGGQPVGVNAKR